MVVPELEDLKHDEILTDRIHDDLTHEPPDEKIPDENLDDERVHEMNLEALVEVRLENMDHLRREHETQRVVHE